MLDLLRSKWCPVDREGCGVPQNRGNGLVLEHYGRNGGPVHRGECGVPQKRTPRDTVHLHVDCLHGLLFIHRRLPPWATVHPPSTSCNLHLRLFIHGLLFIQPPPRSTPPATIQPALSTGSCSTTPPRVLFIQLSTVYYSSSPPRGRHVHPALHEVLFIHPQPAR